MINFSEQLIEFGTLIERKGIHKDSKHEIIQKANKIIRRKNLSNSFGLSYLTLAVFDIITNGFFISNMILFTIVIGFIIYFNINYNNKLDKIINTLKEYK